MKPHSSEKRLFLPLDYELTLILIFNSQNRTATSDLWKEEAKKKETVQGKMISLLFV